MLDSSGLTARVLGLLGFSTSQYVSQVDGVVDREDPVLQPKLTARVRKDKCIRYIGLLSSGSVKVVLGAKAEVSAARRIAPYCSRDM